MQIAVCGPADPRPEDVTHAFEAGRLLAGHGATVLCGGYGGVMEAAARGAWEAGGTTVGVLSGADDTGANPYLTVKISTGMGEARNVVLVRSALAVIIIGGSWGTLSELALARRMDVPVVSLGGWRVLDAWGEPVEGVLAAGDAAEAVRLALLKRRG
ncbi:TIGR00725 family protein [Actinocorallia sp. B10E7]|uniref:TIGR00725 family protein n=1 Tax=Actinocorallia sp. B10E7 TaxID=3153558 RepID=UPI00325EE5CA